MAHAEHAPGHYYVPHGTRWPIFGSIGLFTMTLGAALWLNAHPVGPWIVTGGFGVLLVMLFGWFGTVIGESERGLYNLRVDASFRWAMGWFIFSEVMFFGVFFGTLFYSRVLVVPWLAGEGENFFTNFMLWPGFENAWPSTGPAGAPVERMEAWGLPAAWVDYTGPVEGETLGLAIFSHPKCFRPSPRWHVRGYGLFAANPFGQTDFPQPELAKQGAVTIKQGDKLSLRYRVLLHRGTTDEADVAGAFEEFAATP